MNFNRIILKILILTIAIITTSQQTYNTVFDSISEKEAQKYIWGTWKITGQYMGGAGWQECDDDRQGVIVEFLPDRVIYEKEELIISAYSTECLAIRDKKDLYHEVSFQNLGLMGDYFLKFIITYTDKEQLICPFSSFVLISDSEMLLISGRAIYKAEREKGNVNIDEGVLQVGSRHSICYGTWEIVGGLPEDEEAEKQIGRVLEIRDEENPPVFCSIYSKELIEADWLDLTGVSNNSYYVCYVFSNNSYWDRMIVIDGMTAITIKDKKWYLIWSRCAVRQIEREGGYEGKEKYYREDEKLKEYKQLFDESETTSVSMIGVILYSESDDGFIEYTEE